LWVHVVPGTTSLELAAQVREILPFDVGIALVVVGANDLARFVAPAPRPTCRACRGAGRFAPRFAPVPQLTCDLVHDHGC
jgi:hypothetical protein